MRYAILLMGAPYSDQASHSALRFARALLARGHRLEAVFFTTTGSTTPPACRRRPRTNRI